MSDKPMIRVLGPIDIVNPAGPRPLAGRLVRLLLAALVVEVGHSVPTDRLCDTLWNGRPPDSAMNTLQSYVSDLRRHLGSAAIVMVDHSYELEPDQVGIDALEFERLLRQVENPACEPADQWHLCQQALRLWRGPPFGDLGDCESLSLEAHRLDGLRLTAMELSLAADLALGRHALVVGELESAVEEHPYREHLWLLLVRALALDGRRVEALRAAARLRRILAEVGLEASAELATAERWVLEGGD